MCDIKFILDSAARCQACDPIHRLALVLTTNGVGP
jgi:hypothetical protein